MDIFFQDPTEIPLPPNEVRILRLRAEPWPDNRRVRIYLELTPFQKRPNGEVRILDASGEEVATVTIVEAIDRKMEFTVHLREVPTGGEYNAFATVYYAEAGEEIRQGDGGDEIKNLTPIPSEITVIDRAETRFQIPI
jgi:hypothetical protein